MKEIRCGNCGSTIKINEGEGIPFSKLPDGIHYLMPSIVRNENKGESSNKGVNARLKALEDAGISIEKMKELANSTADFKELFEENDPLFDELSKGGFIRNPELFRRFICAQTFRLLRDPRGWTHAVKHTYDIYYVMRQSKRELELLCKLKDKKIKQTDKRYQFFTFEALKRIFKDLEDMNNWDDYSRKEDRKRQIDNAYSYDSLYRLVSNMRFHLPRRTTAFPRDWLNCFKGAGAYYTLQNIIRTHGFLVKGCKTMDESLKYVDDLYQNIVSYSDKHRRWDIMMSVLIGSVKESGFELKW